MNTFAKLSALSLIAAGALCMAPTQADAAIGTDPVKEVKITLGLKSVTITYDENGNVTGKVIECEGSGTECVLGKDGEWHIGND